MISPQTLKMSELWYRFGGSAIEYVSSWEDSIPSSDEMCSRFMFSFALRCVDAFASEALAAFRQVLQAIPLYDRRRKDHARPWELRITTRDFFLCKKNTEHYFLDTCQMFDLLVNAGLMYGWAGWTDRQSSGSSRNLWHPHQTRHSTENVTAHRTSRYRESHVKHRYFTSINTHFPFSHSWHSGWILSSRSVARSVAESMEEERQLTDFIDVCRESRPEFCLSCVCGILHRPRFKLKLQKFFCVSLVCNSPLPNLSPLTNVLFGGGDIFNQFFQQTFFKPIPAFENKSTSHSIYL